MPLPVAASLVTIRADRVQNQGGAETDLINIRLPPGLLQNIGDCLRIFAAVSLAANANNKTEKVYINTTQVSGRTNTSNNLPRTNQIVVVKRGANLQSAIAINNEHGAGALVILTDLTADESIPILVRFTGQGVATGDLESRILGVEYIPASTNFQF